MSGCRTCANHYMQFGDSQCRKRPHDGATEEQRAIVAWLSRPGRVAHGDPGCPGHVHTDYRKALAEYAVPVVTRSRAEVAAMYDGPRPAGVAMEYVPPTGTHPAVGVATVDGKATCPKCPESIESRATYARVPAHAGPTPAESAIFERGGYVPTANLSELLPALREAVAACEAAGDSVPIESLLLSPERLAMWKEGARPTCSHVPPGMSGLCHACRSAADGMADFSQSADDQRREWARRAALKQAMDQRIADATRRIFEADVRQTCDPRTTGGIVGLDVMLPPISELVTPKNKALLEKHGAALEAACREVAQDERCEAGCSLVLGHVGRCITERGALRSHPMPNVTADAVASVATTPAAMLGEALVLLERIEALGIAAHASTPTMLSEVNFRVRVANVREHLGALKRETEARLASCPRGIHGGSDACDCAAIAKEKARDGQK